MGDGGVGRRGVMRLGAVVSAGRGRKPGAGKCLCWSVQQPRLLIFGIVCGHVVLARQALSEPAVACGAVLAGRLQLWYLLLSSLGATGALGARVADAWLGAVAIALCGADVCCRAARGMGADGPGAKGSWAEATVGVRRGGGNSDKRP